MPEHLKVTQSVSPVARSGGGDISEKELSRERSHLFTTPTTRPRVHPKRQLFSVPVNKFTAKSPNPSRNLARIKSCLDEYRKSPPKAHKISAKAASMEDLTPTKRTNRECTEEGVCVVRRPLMRSADEEQAAATIGRFMLVASWRRRRDDVRCLRKTLEFQVSCSERLRIQVRTLKSLLDSDNAKVRLAIRELERLKQLVRDKDVEKAVLDKEKQALEQDVCDAEDRAAEMNIGWRNCRNELESCQAALVVGEQALCAERAATADARAQRDHAYRRLAMLEDDLTHHEAMLASAEEEVDTLKRELRDRQAVMDQLNENLNEETEARAKYAREGAALRSELSRTRAEREALKALVATLRERLTHVQLELAAARRRRDWWPRPITRILGVARSWLRPLGLSDAVLWVLVPSRHGC